MTSKSFLRLSADILMTLALLFLMGYQFWGEGPHEWVGLGMFILFIIHHILNIRWHKAIFKGRYSAKRFLTLFIDFLVLITMLAQMYSSIVISRYVLDFLSFDGNIILARRLHILGAYWGFILMSLHLGLHWNMVLSMTKRFLKINYTSKIFSTALFFAGLIIALFGAKAFIFRNFPIYLLLKSEFVFFDYSEPIILFYLDYIALMGLFIFAAHYSTKLIEKIKKEGGKQP